MNPKMPSRDNSHTPSSPKKIGNAFGFLGLAASALLLTQPAVAQRAVVHEAIANNPQSLQAAQSFRDNFSLLLDSYGAVFKAQGNTRRQEQVAQAQAAMQRVSSADLAYVFSRGSLPDLAPAVSAMQRVAAAHVAASSAARNSPKVPLLAPAAQLGTGNSIASTPFPDASTTVIDDCSQSNTPHTDQSTYDALIAAQVTSGILAAAAWVCNEDVLGENGSAVCIPFAIADDIAQSLFATRNFCSGLDQSAMVEGNSNRLAHIHSDLANDLTTLQGNITTATTTITTNDNSNETAIVTNDNTNTASIIANIGAGTTTVTNNADANTTTIINNATANTTQIINNANANTTTITTKIDADMNILRDLTLRTWIELALAENQGVDVVSLQVPQAFGGYLELVRTITAQAIASVQASGGKIGNAQSQLAAGDAALAAHQYATAYKNYKQAYRGVVN